MPPPDAGAAHTRLVTENATTMQHRNSEAMDTLLLFGQKEQETRELQEKLQSQADEIEALRARSFAQELGAPFWCLACASCHEKRVACETPAPHRRHFRYFRCRSPLVRTVS